uniref:Bifunctional oligoribonuclease/PAP phosphatase NrnA n=1 Tax=candidate division WOR-3 bacterium TaxID=2052148 RepID=A0A7C4U6U3_UNCW3
MDEALEFLLKSDSFLITSHKNPDGDAIGSQIAFALALMKKGKKQYIYNVDPVPKRFRHFEYVHLVHNEPPDMDYDAVIVLDSASPERIGNIKDKIDFSKPVLNIDHHISNEFFGKINIIRSYVSSTCEIAYEILKNFCEIDKEIATYIYLGIVTDTGSFRYSNTNAESMKTASELLSYGVDASLVSERIWYRETLGKLRLLGAILETIEVEDGFSIMYVTKEMMRRFNTEEEDTEEVVQYGLMIDGVKAAAIVKERDEELKVSLRSKNDVDVDAIAGIYHGGGHKNAAGFTVKKKNIYEFIKELKEVLKERI